MLKLKCRKCGDVVEITSLTQKYCKKCAGKNVAQPEREVCNFKVRGSTPLTPLLCDDCKAQLCTFRNTEEAMLCDSIRAKPRV